MNTLMAGKSSTRYYQREPDTSNRYGIKPFDALGTGVYYPCRNVLEVKLEDIQNDFVDMAGLLLRAPKDW